MIRAMIVFAVSASMATAAPVPKEVRKEASREGAWKLLKVESVAGGISTGMTHCWVIDARDEVSFSGPNERSDEKRFRLIFDPAAKYCDYQTASMKVPYSGIYELDRDALKLAIDFNGGPRPKAFATGGGVYIYSFQRVKDSK